jgi:hypothetical protein
MRVVREYFTLNADSVLSTTGPLRRMPGGKSGVLDSFSITNCLFSTAAHYS